MEISLLHYIAFSLGIILGGITTALILLHKHTKERTALESTRNSIKQDLAIKSQELLHYSELRKNFNILESKLETLREENIEYVREIAQLQENLNQYANLSKRHQELHDIVNKRTAELARTTTLLQKEQEISTEKLNIAKEAKEEMAHRFKNVAQEIFAEKGLQFNTRQEKELGHILNPLKEQISSFNKRINDLHDSSSKDQASLRQEITTLRNANISLNMEAKNLSQALKGDQKIQGNWGEMILEKVLEHSGLRKDIEYETQTGHRDDQQKLFKPDVIVHLPEGRDIIIDSKVSLSAYERSCRTNNAKEKQQALTAHIASIRKHIKELSDKDYGNLPGLKSPDFVLMFMPIEPAFISAFQADENLFQYGFEQRIIVVTPSTLLATLRTIENIWRFEHQNQNTREIAARASKIYEKLRLYLVSMDDLGKQLTKAQSSYDQAINRLAHGRGNLVTQTHELIKLGVKVKKELPVNILELSTDTDSTSVDYIKPEESSL